LGRVQAREAELLLLLMRLVQREELDSRSQRWRLCPTAGSGTLALMVLEGQLLTGMVVQTHQQH
jgi:hypothetical protein